MRLLLGGGEPGRHQVGLAQGENLQLLILDVPVRPEQRVVIGKGQLFAPPELDLVPPYGTEGEAPCSRPGVGIHDSNSEVHTIIVSSDRLDAHAAVLVQDLAGAAQEGVHRGIVAPGRGRLPQLLRPHLRRARRIGGARSRVAAEQDPFKKVAVAVLIPAAEVVLSGPAKGKVKR